MESLLINLTLFFEFSTYNLFSLEKKIKVAPHFAILFIRLKTKFIFIFSKLI